MKLQLFTAAALSLGMVVGTATLATGASTGNPAGDLGGHGSRTASDSSGREDNTGYLVGPPTVGQTSSAAAGETQPMFHGMSSASRTQQKPCGGDYTKMTQANGTCRHIGAQ